MIYFLKNINTSQTFVYKRASERTDVPHGFSEKRYYTRIRVFSFSNKRGNPAQNEALCIGTIDVY